MVISRGPRRGVDTKPGEERAAFLSMVGACLQTDPSELDMLAGLVEHYGVDELEVFEYVGIAEDVWRVRLNPDPMTNDDISRMLSRYATLESIVAGAEAEPRCAWSQPAR